MKANFQKKVSLNRKTSVTGSSSKERQLPPEEKVDKLTELRAKIQKERQVMRTSGKRFKEASSTMSGKKAATTTAESLYKLDKNEGSRFLKKETKVTEVSVGQEPVQKVQQQPKPQPKESLDLTTLVTEPQNVSLNSSRLFEKQLQQQKGRNKEVEHFLGKIGLEEFSEGLINLGYDQLDVLIEVTSEELNFLMMRASQQGVLNSALKEYREKQGLTEARPATSDFGSTSTCFKTRARNEAVRSKKEQKWAELIRPKSALTVASTVPTNNSGLFSASTVKPNPIFFIGIGGQQWSMDSLVRRACTVCFKVFPGGQLTQEEGNYYCKPCKQKEQDPLGMLMNNSMIRDYKL